MLLLPEGPICPFALLSVPKPGTRHGRSSPAPQKCKSRACPAGSEPSGNVSYCVLVLEEPLSPSRVPAAWLQRNPTFPTGDFCVPSIPCSVECLLKSFTPGPSACVIPAPQCVLILSLTPPDKCVPRGGRQPCVCDLWPAIAGVGRCFHPAHLL